MKLLKTLGYYILVVFLVVYIFTMAFSPSKMMDIFGFRTFIVLSESMVPTINVNDMIISKEVNEDELEVDDIITFSVYIPELDDLGYVTHYIKAIESDGVNTIYKTQGEGREESQYDLWEDADGNDIEITFDDIEGVYLFRVPYVGYIQEILSNKMFLGLIILNVSVLYLTVSYIKKKK